MTMTPAQKARWRAAIKPLVIEMYQQGIPLAELFVIDIKNVTLRLSASPMGDGDAIEIGSSVPKRSEPTK